MLLIDNLQRAMVVSSRLAAIPQEAFVNFHRH